MRLFEIDQGGVLTVLKTLKGLADKPGGQRASILSWPNIQKELEVFKLGINTPDGFRALTIGNADPETAQAYKDVISSIDDDGNVTLNTAIRPPDDDAQSAQTSGSGPNLDKMARANSSLGAPKSIDKMARHNT